MATTGIIGRLDTILDRHTEAKPPEEMVATIKRLVGANFLCEDEVSLVETVCEKMWERINASLYDDLKQARDKLDHIRADIIGSVEDI